MKIGILGAGSIGATLTRRLSHAGHEVKVANSRGPETIDPDILAFGARPAPAAEVVVNVEVLIVSIPLSRLPETAPLIRTVSGSTVIIDTSNYYPLRDGRIEALEAGQVESLWVCEQFGRPVVKAWNAITAGSFAQKATGAGDPGRIAIPVAADRDADRAVAMTLVEETGFDAFDAGSLAGSWRQQPGAPCYCTDLTRQQMPEALTAADAARSPRRRDLAMAAVAERMESGASVEADYLVRLNRVLYT